MHTLYNVNSHIPLWRSSTNIVNLIDQHRKLDRSSSEPTTRYKTELCRPYEESGVCKYGDKCQFAHGCNELRNLDRHPKYKTELCRTFHKTGFCPYGPRCHFVHNIEEARIDKFNSGSPSFLTNLSSLLSINKNISLLERLTVTPQSNVEISSTDIENSLSTLTNIVLVTNQHHEHRLNQSLCKSSIQCKPNRPKPLNLSPTVSIGSVTDSISPSSSLSQSPTNSMGSFFSEERPQSNNPTNKSESFRKEVSVTATCCGSDKVTSLQKMSSKLLEQNARSSFSVSLDSRLPIFNEISKNLDKFNKLKC